MAIPVVVSGYRMHNRQQHTVGVPPHNRRKKLVTGLTDDEANEWEVDLIDILGFVHDGSGCLRNEKRGGNIGSTGWVPSEEYRQQKSKANKKYWREHQRAC